MPVVPALRSIWGNITNNVRVNRVWDCSGSGVPVDGTTGASVCGPGSSYTDILTGVRYYNTGTYASPVWVSGVTGIQASGSISAADIVGTGVGQFGHANGVPLVAAVGAHKVFSLIELILIYDFAVAAYTAGGNITVNNSGGGAALTGLVSAANSVGAATDKVVQLIPLAAAGNAMVENGGFNLVSSAAFTQPGTAAGIITWIARYRITPTGLV